MPKVKNVDYLVAFPEPYVVAEIANAHNGDFELLETLITSAKDAGADGVKFQWFQQDSLCMPDDSRYQIFGTLAFESEQWVQAVSQARGLDLDVWVDVTDEWAIGQIQICQDDIYGIKIPPSVFLDTNLAKEALGYGKITLIGVGGHEEVAIQRQVNIFREVNRALILQHGFQGYPTEPSDATLRRLAFLRERYQLPVSFADHEDAGSELALRLPEYAYFAGAILIEKHICLDRSLRGHDYYSSLEQDEFRLMADNLRSCRIVMGGIEITTSQREYLSVASRSVLRASIATGDTIGLGDIMYRRTSLAEAMTPDIADHVLPAVATRNMKSGEALQRSDCRPHRIVAVVPCRMKSTRLRNKAILPISGVSSIQRCLINAMAAKHIDHVVLATSTHSEDGVLEEHALAVDSGFFRGSEEDVIERFLSVASQYEADILLRITGDCPVISYEIADMLIESHLETQADVTYCDTPFPVGINSEVYKLSSLQRLRSLVPNTNFSEYMLSYFTNNPEYFQLNPVTLPELYRHPEWRLTLDVQEDLDMFNFMFSEMDLGMEPVSFVQIVDFFSRNPHVAEINSGISLAYVDDDDLVLKIKQETTVKE